MNTAPEYSEDAVKLRFKRTTGYIIMERVSDPEYPGTKKPSVTYWTEDHEEPVPHQVKLHSPTGFEWGYGGSGPSDLSLNILLFLGLPKNHSHRLHQQFKSEIIAAVPSEEGAKLSIPDVIAPWLLRQRPLASRSHACLLQMQSLAKAGTDEVTVSSLDTQEHFELLGKLDPSATIGGRDHARLYRIMNALKSLEKRGLITKRLGSRAVYHYRLTETGKSHNPKGR